MDRFSDFGRQLGNLTNIRVRFGASVSRYVQVLLFRELSAFSRTPEFQQINASYDDIGLRIQISDSAEDPGHFGNGGPGAKRGHMCGRPLWRKKNLRR